MMSTHQTQTTTQAKYVMKTLDEIRCILSIMNLRKVAEGAKVHYNAIHRIAKGDTNPSYDTVQKIVKYLEDQGLLK